MTVAAECQNFSSHVMVHRENFPRGGGIGKPVSVGRGIDLNALSILYNLRKNFLHIMFHIAERINAQLIISQNQVKMPQHTVILVILYQIQKLLIISLIVFFLGPSLLKFLRPEAFILDLMNRQNNKVKRVSLVQGFKLWDRVFLHPELQTHFNGKPVCVLAAQTPDLLHISRIIHVHHGKTIAIGNL